MNMESFTEHIMKFDLTRQEAVIYECLLKNGKQTGYETAKMTGISRSNVYGALSALVDKGAAQYEEEPGARKYMAVDPQEFCENRIEQLKREEDWILLHVPEKKEEEDGYIAIAGRDHILSKARKLLQDTKERVYVSGNAEFLGEVLPVIREKETAGKKVVLITDCTEIDGPGKVYHTKDRKSQIGMIVDSRYVLSGEFGENTQNTCVYSGQRNFAELFKEAMANEIKLIRLTEGEQ